MTNLNKGKLIRSVFRLICVIVLGLVLCVNVVNGQSTSSTTQKVEKITDDNFETEVLKSAKPTIVDFFADWCGPCKQIAPVLEEISDELKDKIIIAKHDIDNEPNTPTKYGVKGIPTMLLFKNGELKGFYTTGREACDFFMFFLTSKKQHFHKILTIFGAHFFCH